MIHKTVYIGSLCPTENIKKASRSNSFYSMLRTISLLYSSDPNSACSNSGPTEESHTAGSGYRGVLYNTRLYDHRPLCFKCYRWGYTQATCRARSSYGHCVGELSRFRPDSVPDGISSYRFTVKLLIMMLLPIPKFLEGFSRGTSMNSLHTAAAM